MSLPHFVPLPLPRMTARQKFDANCAALRVLRALEGEQRPATEAERSSLALYTGWGDTDVRKFGLRWDGSPTQDLLDALDITPAVVAGGWSSVPVLASISRSALNAHYTDVSVVRAMWAMLGHLGFGDLRAPRVLEPSAGVGHFAGCAPVDSSDLMAERVTMIELDPVSAAICRALYPRCDVRATGFERCDLPAVYDVVVGNVPFGDYQVAETEVADGVPRQCRQQVHDYFVCRSVSLLRPGGVACLVTSKGTLDKRSRHVRQWLAERCDLLVAYRMPRDAFLECAGTQVTADVLVLRRLPHDQPGRGTGDGAPEWVDVAPVSFPGKYGGVVQDAVNCHFHSHPDHVLGEWCQNELVFSPDAGVRRHHGDDRPVAGMLAALVGRLPAGALAPPAKRADPGADAGRTPRQLAESPGLSPTPQGLALGRLLRALRRVAECDAGSDPVRGAQLRRLLRSSYDAYRVAHGAVRDAERDPRHPLAPATSERWWPFLASLEDDQGRRTGVFDASQVSGAARATPQTALDAVYQVIDERGSFTIEQVVDRMNGVA